MRALYLPLAVEAAIWKVVADSAAQGHLLVDLEQFMLDRTPPLALLPPDALALIPDPLPDTLLPQPLPDDGHGLIRPQSSLPVTVFAFA